MITSSREADFSPKLEGEAIDARISKASSTATPWLRSKDPRIVRVSRTFGGKDRHSKVCTVRGLRDRRVRLSVPTAIQLYDLQDRLGLNQPSKVVDWLLNAAKNEIDELPPLQMPPGNFIQSHQPMITNLEVGTSQFNKEELKISNGIDWEDPTGLPRPSFWGSNALLRAKSKEIDRENGNEKVNWMKIRNDEKQEGIEGHGRQVSSNTFAPRSSNQSSFPGLLSSSMPYATPFYHLEPSNLSLSNLGSHGFTSQAEDIHNFSVLPLSSSLSLTSGSQVLVCPQGSKPTYFPGTTSMEFDPRQINHFQLLSSTSQTILPNSVTPPLYSMGQHVRPLHLSMAHKTHQSQSISGSNPSKNN